MKDSALDTGNLSVCVMVDKMQPKKTKRIDTQLAKERARWLKKQKRNKGK